MIDLRELIQKISQAKDKSELQNIKSQFLGKNSQINQEFKKLGSLSEDEKKIKASSLNNEKQKITDSINIRFKELEKLEISQKLQKDKVDVTLPARERPSGKVHPVSQVIDEISSIFSEIGFSVAEGPDVETEYNNFTALNTPEDHPARQEHDTFYMHGCNKKKLLRTHTSPIQIRVMKEKKPPIKIIAPGNTYRCDDDATHSPMFHQIEGLVVDKNISMANLKWTIKELLASFFNVYDLPMRFRPSYFPFTEPSAEVDIGCEIEDGKLVLGKGKKWLEVLGCGMVNPKVFKNCEIDTNIYSGFAFGLGVERFAMLKYGITDLRMFYENDHRWLKHYSFRPTGFPNTLKGS